MSRYSHDDYYCSNSSCQSHYRHDDCKYKLDHIQVQFQLQQLQKQLQLQQQRQEQLQAQLQQQEQNQAQTQNDTDTISNVGNPTVNVNVNTGRDDNAASVDRAGKLVEFAYDTQNSTDPTEPGTLISNFPDRTLVANLTLNNVDAGNVVWLNGLFHVLNISGDTKRLQIEIHRNVIGNIIYNAFTEIDENDFDENQGVFINNDDNINQIITVQHVDAVGANRMNAQYFLTVANLDGGNVRLRGPITFTAAEIDI